MKIDVEEYLMGREKLYPCSQEIRDNAAVTVERVNELLAFLEAKEVPLEKHPRILSIVTSGWRPPQINSQVKNAAPKSKHMTGEACDLYDPEGLIDHYLSENPDTLINLRLWMEHPSATKGWSHVQIVGPRSGKRIFYP